MRHSADPMVRKQALAIAESLLLEIEQQPFTWCDPQDEKAATAVGSGDCTTSQSSLAGPSPAGEARGSLTNPFDNVADYGGLNGAATDLNGNGLAGYTVDVAITEAGGVAPFADMPAGAMLRIAVTVMGRGENVTLVGYRARYAPNAAG
ncbi:type II secretion system protein [Propionivibrio soli]|uniref:type II secretion system protein n=1 Tax=Propionivibrio soli TaxID=2976531 RepID=UPI003B84764A